MRIKKFFVFFIFIVLFSSIFAMSGASALTPRYFPVHRKIKSIEDFMWPVRIKSNTELRINVTTTAGFLTITFEIPNGFESEMYFKDAKTGKYYYRENFTGSGGEGGMLHEYIKSTGLCIIGLSGMGEIRLMYFPGGNTAGDISSSKNITTLFYQVAMHLANPAYFKFKTPKEICVYGFSSSHVLTGMDESDSTEKTVVINAGDVSGIEMAFFVFYNRSGGPVHDVKLIDYGPYTGGKSLPAIYGLIPLSLILIAVGVTWYWIKKKG